MMYIVCLKDSFGWISRQGQVKGSSILKPIATFSTKKRAEKFIEMVRHHVSAEILEISSRLHNPNKIKRDKIIEELPVRRR